MSTHHEEPHVKHIEGFYELLSEAFARLLEMVEFATGYDQLRTPAREINKPTVDPVPAATNTVTLLAGNGNRRIGLIYNDSSAILYVKFGPRADTADFSVALNQGDSIDVYPYRGEVTGVWASATGQARVTEVSF